MTPKQALEKLRLEMQASPAESVLLSSELSPFYFNNPRFSAFVSEHFSRVVVIFTIRAQSELLLSLFNQLVKDPNVRYGASLFTLAMRNIHWVKRLTADTSCELKKHCDNVQSSGILLGFLGEVRCRFS